MRPRWFLNWRAERLLAKPIWKCGNDKVGSAVRQFDQSRSRCKGPTSCAGDCRVKKSSATRFRAVCPSFWTEILGGVSRAKWALRYAATAMPSSANGFNFDPKILLANSQNLENQSNFSVNNRRGHLHRLAYVNNANMGSYSQSLAQMPVNPDITATRAYRSKYGFGVSLDLELTNDLGVFSRLGWNNGQTESFVFTEVDRTASLGLALQGTRWGRRNDQIGLAGIINAISGVHAAYLAAGGLGFQLGDGKLDYGYDEIVEMDHRFQLRPGIHISADFQEINNPGYNRDRGPVAVGLVRFHFEF
jgi:high affinity Mn2+ porin